MKLKKQNFSSLFILSLFLFLFPEYIYTAPNSGSTIVSWAGAVIGSGYEEGKPLNAPDDGYGIVWKSPLDTSKFDCSGLVSYVAGLRRRYTTSALKNYYLDSVSAWSSLQAGNILHTDGVAGTSYPNPHVMIVIERKPGPPVKVRVIHARSVGVVEEDYEENTLKDTWKFFPYRFKSDSTNPTITVYGIQDGGKYSYSVTVSFSVSDNISGSDFYAYGEYSGTKFKSKIFSSDGNYTVRFVAVDWAVNIAGISKSFSIDTIPPYGSILINNGATYTNSPYVTLNLWAYDAGSGVADMRFSNDGWNWSNWIPYSQTVSWSVPPGEGWKWVYVQYRDNLGCISDTFTYFSKSEG